MHSFNSVSILLFFFADVDTDELDADTENVEEEIVEFFIKEEITMLD